MSLTTVEIELEKERNELRQLINFIAFQLTDMIVSELSTSERRIFNKLCEADFMVKAKVGDEWVAKLL